MRSIVYSAVNGSAASNLPGGKTLCNVGGFNPTIKSKNPSSKIELPQLSSRGKEKEKFYNLQLMFQENHALMCIDEVSLMTALYLIHTSNRLRQFTDADHTLLPFGNHNVVLMGNWDQIAAIGATIPDSLFRKMIHPSEIRSPDEDLIMEAVELFRKANKNTESARILATIA